MKSKITLLILLFSSLVYNSQAQDYKSAIGLRLGTPWSFSYKSFINERNALEGVVGFKSSPYYSWFNIGGYYEHYTPIESTEGLSWYYGGGLNISFWTYDDALPNSSDYGSTVVGISGILGLDYKIKDTPLNLSIDWTPTVFISGYTDGFGGGYGALGVRYVLN
jgi:hypothetical protein